jgi:hypothetical protein
LKEYNLPINNKLLSIYFAMLVTLPPLNNNEKLNNDFALSTTAILDFQFSNQLKQ